MAASAEKLNTHRRGPVARAHLGLGGCPDHNGDSRVQNAAVQTDNLITSPYPARFASARQSQYSLQKRRRLGAPGA